MRAIWVLLLLGAWSAATCIGPQCRDASASCIPTTRDCRPADQRIVMLAADWCGYCRKQQKDFELAKRALPRLRRRHARRRPRDAGARAHAACRSRVIGQQVVRGYDTAELKQHLTPLGYQVY